MIFALQDEPEKGRRILILVLGAWVAAALWGGGLFAANRMEPKERPKQVAIRMKIFEKPKPPPPKEEAPPTEAPPPPPPTAPPPPTEPPPKIKPKPKPKEPEPPKPPPPAPVTAAPKPVVEIKGMTFDSTDDRGKGPAVQVGNDFGGYDRGKAQAPETRPPTPPEPPPPAREPVREGATVVKKVSGEYTRAALRAGIEGKVIVVVTISEDGTVKDAKLIQGLGYGLDEVALEAAKKWVFKPATLDGKAILSTKRITVDFVIED